jgi:predicted amidophosphoribosyltransferase
VKQVYKLINKEKIENKRIILFDDIYTTGSTVDECSKILKKNGAKEILVFTIAKDII